MNGIEIDHNIHVRYAKERLQAGVSADDLKDEMMQLYRESKGFFMWAHFGETPTRYPGNKNELVFRNLIKRAQSELGHSPGQPQQRQQQSRRDDSGDDWESRLQKMRGYARRQAGLPVDTDPPQQQPKQQQQAAGDDWESRLEFIRTRGRVRTGTESPRQQRMPAPEPAPPQAETKSWEERLQFMKDNVESICRGV